jgi:hypothetical protein
MRILLFPLVIVLLTSLTASKGFAKSESDELTLDEPSGPSPVVKPTPVPSPAATLTPTTQKESPWRYVVGIGYHMASNTTFYNASTTSGGVTTSGSAEFDSQPVYEVIAGFKHILKHHFGYFGDLTYQSRRRVNSVTLNFGGSTLPYAGPKPVSQIFVTTLGVLYQWDRFYLPVGINYLTYGIADPGDSGGYQDQVGGALGSQLGIGYFFTTHFSLEAQWKTIAMTAQVSNAVTTIDFQTGYTTGLAIDAFYSW